MEKLHSFLKIFLWVNVGVFAGRTGFRVWQYLSKPQMFAPQSAPWYLSIQLSALFTAILVSILLFAICLTERKLKRNTSLFRLGCQISSVTALCVCILMGFEIFGYHTDYDLVAVEAVIIGLCLAINLVCAVLRLFQEKRK